MTTAGKQAVAMPFSTFVPDIDGEACLLAISAASRCTFCVTACPSRAILLDDNGLSIDEEACVGCGLCVPACPEGAIAPLFLPLLHDYAGYKTVFVACHPALDALPTNFESHGVPCLNAIGLRGIVEIQRKGTELVVMAACPGSNCLSGTDGRIGKTTALARAMFLSREERFPEIRMVDIDDWRAMLARAKPCNPGRIIDRRGLLGMFAPRRDTEAEYGRDTLGAFGFPRRTENDIAAIVPGINAEKCSGCDACTRVCPHGAILHRKDSEAEGYIIDPVACTGCRLCIDICAEDAVSLSGPGNGTRQHISLKLSRCTACGVPFHYPEARKENGHLCRICTKIGPAKKLFFVERHE